MRDRRCSWTRGKVLGGSSVLNTMLYIRGNKRDYDNWAKLGNEGWSFDEVLPYFLKSEDQRNPYLAKSKYHATGGYQTIQDTPYLTPLAIAFLQAGQEMGFDIRDVNGEIQTGFALFQYTMRRGTRCSAAKAFLRPIRLRPNLHISLWTHATKVLIDPNTRKAYGIEYYKDGRFQTVRARKEVILAAGAINSPQLLMLSGVGPAEHLRKFDINVLKDAPGVGKNLQDHIAAGGMTFLIDQPVGIITNRLVNINAAVRYAVSENGPLTSSVGIETVGFISTKYANQTDDWPDMELMILSTSTNADGGLQVKRAHGLSDEFYEAVYRSIDFKDVYGIFPMMLRPHSTGEILLQSKNPFRYPLLYHNYLTDYRDVAVLREGVKFSVAFSETASLKRFGSRFHNVPLPNCKHLPLYTDDYWDCYVRQYTLSIYHYSCTTKMGPATDPMAVVDPTLKVYGIGGLRVIDASIFPKIPNGNINAPVLMVAEKGADLIKADWLNRRGGKKKRELRNMNETVSMELGEKRFSYLPKNSTVSLNSSWANR
ncbi:glucose dehydrogenase [FAD, quinone] isoform X1 [Agrilus planipennis]|nr:glucose dehydrogenase [FAD, quinone] isoform X1 [Agrilus planipennis]